VLLETNGTLDLGNIADACVKIMDIKCPSSLESAHNNLKNMEYLNKNDQVKFVMQTRADYEFAKALIPALEEMVSGHHILFSPVTTNLKPGILAQWMLEDHLSARLQLQLHKIIWPDKDRGV
jgi:7-carboxy-7-deazaguanine synthase